jgi:hypothetical protein
VRWLYWKPAIVTWKRFVVLFARTFAATLAVSYAFVLLVDPYDIVPFSLRFERSLVSISYPFMYPQVVRSGKFDSLIVGTSTSRLLDPAFLGKALDVRLANLAVNSMMAWEQKTMVEYFERHVGPPKALIVAIDGVWCNENADRARHNPVGWPDWLYDDNPWNDYLYLLNEPTLEIAVRLVGNKLGLYRERVRFDGFEVFTPPDETYDLERARRDIWRDRSPETVPDLPPPPLSERERASLSFPALEWLDRMMSRLPASTTKVMAFMPVHVAAQPWPGTKGAAIEAACKARIAEIGRKTGAKVIDWRIASPITREDRNYWDSVHYRLPIAQRLQQEIVDALNGRRSADGTYRILVE